MVDLAVRAAPLADDREHVAQLVFAIQGGCVVAKLLDESCRLVGDVYAPAAAHVAEERQHAVALGKPAVLADEFGCRLRRKLPGRVLPRQPAEQAGVESHDAHGVVDARAGVADAHLHGGIGLGRADVPPDLAGILDERHALVLAHKILVFGCGPQRLGKPGAVQRAEQVHALRLEARQATHEKRRR